MAFRDAARELGMQITSADMAAAFGVSEHTVRQARLEPGAAGHRRPPDGWERVVASLAEERAERLLALAAELRATGE